METIFEIPKNASKIEKYKIVLKYVESLIEDETNLISNLANTCAVIKIFFNEEFSWVGTYLKTKSSRVLTLGPFQGKPACTRIKIGVGVCGKAAKSRKSIIVPDVSKFPGHIYCDPDTKSEIVIPMIANGYVIGVLDIDSYNLDAFNEIDRFYLEKIVELIIYKKKD